MALNKTNYTDYEKYYQSYGRRWDSFTGADMHIIFHTKRGEAKLIGTVSSLTIAIVREVVPRYTSGSADVRSFAKGRRGISGTMTFSIFDRHPILREAYADLVGKSYNELWKDYYQTKEPDKSYKTGTGEISNALQESINQAMEVREWVGRFGRLQYLDQLPPVDVTISFVNDSGAASTARVMGVTFLSEGIGFGQDDVNQELASTYTAAKFESLTPVMESESIPIAS